MMEDNNFLTLSQASRLTGKSKSVISNALRSGALRHVSRDSTGYKIDHQEIIRVFGHPEPKKKSPTSDHKRELLEYKVQVLEEKNKYLTEYLEFQKNDFEQHRQFLEKQLDTWRRLADSYLEKFYKT